MIAGIENLNSNNQMYPEEKVTNTSTDEVFVHQVKLDCHGIVNSEVEGYEEILKKCPVERWHKNRLLIYLYCLVVYFMSTTNGYDGSLLTALISIPEFMETMNIKDALGTGLVMSIFQIGQMVVVAFIWVGDFIGRKKAILLGSSIVVLGAILTSVANGYGLFIGGRFLLSFGSGIACSMAITYLLEITPPDERSALCGIFNTLYNIGNIIATWTSYGTNIAYQGQSQAYRIPLWLQVLCPGIVVVGIIFCPESPRYQFMKGKPDQARKFFVKYHANGDESHPIVEFQMAQMEMASLNSPKLSFRNYFDYRVLFSNRSNTLRTLLLMTFAWISQFSGSAVIGYYQTQIYLSLGIKSSTTRLLLNGINSILSLIFSVLGSQLIGKLGRRFLFLYSTGGFVISFAALAGCMSAFEKTGSEIAGRAGIAWMFIFNNLFFAIGYTPLQPLYPAEIMSNSMRAKGMSMMSLVLGTAGFVNTYAAPIAMENIKYWFYIFFAFWNTFSFVVIYIFFVETKGLTLEEIDLVFISKHPVKSSVVMSKGNDSSKIEKAKLSEKRLMQNGKSEEISDA